MAAIDKKRILIVIRHSPYGSSLAKSAMDVALAMAAFEQSVDLLFMGEGVLQLLPHQSGQALGTRTISKNLASLPLYDIESVYVDATAVARWQLDLEQVPVATQELNGPQMHQLMSNCNHLLGF